MTHRAEYFLWYRPMDKSYFSECSEQYDGFAISAHILAHNVNSFSVFQSSIDKPYFIDPETFVFQKADIDLFRNRKGGIRTSWKKIGKYFGSAIMDVLENKRSLRDTDFLSANGSFEPSISELTERVLSFQRNVIVRTVSGLSHFLRKTPSRARGLLFLVAPYFFFDSLSDPWYRITLEMTRTATNLKNIHPLYAAICTTKEVLMSDGNVETIAKDFDIEGLDGFLIWINNLKEEEQPKEVLGNILKLVKYLSSRDRKVINLYGGYFSILAWFWGMSAHVSGVCYRDSRGVSEPPIYGGPPGGPIPRFYIPKFHTKITWDEAIRVLQQFPELRCNCPVCSNNITAYESRAERSFARFIMNKHFLYSRRIECEEATETNFERLFDGLNKEYRRYIKSRDILPIHHLAEWYSAIRDSASLLR